MILLVRPSLADLEALRQRLSLRELPYSEAGATGGGTMPAGYHHVAVSQQVGVGDEAWQRARHAVFSWAAHAAAGLQVHPTATDPEPGLTVLCTRSAGPLTVVIPCRVVYCTDEPGRAGFAYGTLPGHPEIGEESFHVVQFDDGRVIFEVKAFSRPADLLTRAGAPIGKLVQSAVIRRYIAGLDRAVRRPDYR